MITKEAIEAWHAKAAVLRARGKNNTLHDIEQAADYLDAAAAFAAMPAEREIDEGRFEEWTLADFAGQCRMQARDNLDPEYSQFMAALAARISPLASENERLKKMIAGCDWYWPEDDTSSDACADGPWQIAENCDVKPGEVFGYSRGGVVETRYYGFLEAAADAGSDDQFEADEPTREAAEAKISAELKRRAALERT